MCVYVCILTLTKQCESVHTVCTKVQTMVHSYVVVSKDDSLDISTIDTISSHKEFDSSTPPHTNSCPHEL